MSKLILIYLNENSQKPLSFIFKHELSHFTEQAGKKYTDVVNYIRNTKNYHQWLKEETKSDGTMEELEAQLNNSKRDTYKKAGEELGVEEALQEIIADFVGNKLFSDANGLDRLLNELEKPARNKVIAWLQDFLNHIKQKLSRNDKKIVAEIQAIEDKLAGLVKESESEKTTKNKTKYSFKGYSKEGNGIYESNFPKGSPKKAKAAKILSYVQNIWSKKPIKLIINKDGKSQVIEAKFDPTYDETGHILTDASKLMGGNRHGNASEQRVTLDLADDYYQIAEESRYNYSKNETGKVTMCIVFLQKKRRNKHPTDFTCCGERNSREFRQ